MFFEFIHPSLGEIIVWSGMTSGQIETGAWSFILRKEVTLMAATRLIALHVNKGRSLVGSLADRTDYAKNPEKTEKGELVTSYCCDPMTVDEEFMLQKRQYNQITGRSQKDDVIAYQIRQSFKPGEVTPEEANRIGQELALRFTKGKYSFIVATHTDRAHIHNHVVFNSTSIDGRRKFRDFRRSGLALQKVSDMICLEHGLSVIEPVPYSARKKRTTFPDRANIRESICIRIDEILASKPKDFSEFLEKLQNAGFEIKTGANTAVKGNGQKRYIRLSSLPEGYRESDIRAILQGERSAENRNPFKKPIKYRAISFDMVLDLQEKIKDKGPGYERWGKIYNLKQMAKTILFLDERNLRNPVRLAAAAAKKSAERDSLLASIQASETRLTEIATLRKHIINYSKTRGTYEEYRKAGYSKKFFEAHREELTLHKAAKAAFDELGVKKIPKVKDLNAEYAELMASKKQAYAEYRKIRDEAQELEIAERNLSALYKMEKEEEQRIQKTEPTHQEKR